MNLIKLFETQRKLDARIVEEKGLHGRDLLPEKIRALLTELGELSNEERSFKFWSEDREPRTFVPNPNDMCEDCKGQGNLNTHLDLRDWDFCKNCDGCGVHFHNPLLEEYVDNLHFILSIGLELHPKVAHMEWAKDFTTDTKTMSLLYGGVEVTDVFIALFKRVLVFGDTQELKDYKRLFSLFLTLGRKLDFTLTDIESAYYSKNETNHARQNNGY